MELQHFILMECYSMDYLEILIDFRTYETSVNSINRTPINRLLKKNF